MPVGVVLPLAVAWGGEAAGASRAEHHTAPTWPAAQQGLVLQARQMGLAGAGRQVLQLLRRGGQQQQVAVILLLPILLLLLGLRLGLRMLLLGLGWGRHSSKRCHKMGKGRG